MIRKKLILCTMCLSFAMTGCSDKEIKQSDDLTSADIEYITSTSIAEETEADSEEYAEFVVTEGELSYAVSVEYKDWKEQGSYRGSDGIGVYYAVDDAGLNIFYQLLGNDTSELIYHADSFDFAYMDYVCDAGYIFIKNKDGINEIWLFEGGESRLLYTLYGTRFPEVSFYENWMFVSYTEKDAGESFLIKLNMKDGTTEEIYRTKITYFEGGRATGDRIVFNGGTNERIYFQVMHLENQLDEECKNVKIYAHENGKVEFVMTPEDVCTQVTGVNNRIVLAEYATDDPLRKNGKIYKEDGDFEVFVLENVLPITTIRECRCYDGLIMFNTLEMIYLYDTNTDTMKNFECVRNSDIEAAYCRNMITYYSTEKQQVCIITVQTER